MPRKATTHTSLPFQYQSSGFSEPGIFVEIYLPKRARFQEILHNTLMDGFKFKKVKKYFKDNKEQIQQVLRHHKQWRSYTVKTIAKMKPLYWGYSIYEVDGVFHSKQKPRGKTKAERRKTIEERTQVIRIMFLPDVALMKKEIGLRGVEYQDLLELIKIFLRVAGHKRGEYGENLVQKSVPDLLRETLMNKMAQGERLGNDKRALLRQIKNRKLYEVIEIAEEWFDDVGLFLFGYVLFEICRKIKELGDLKEVDYEKVIWLTSFWSLNVNRINYRRGSRSKP